MTSDNTQPSIERSPGQQRGLKEFKEFMRGADCPDGLGFVTDGWKPAQILGNVASWEAVRTFDGLPDPNDNRRIL